MKMKHLTLALLISALMPAVQAADAHIEARVKALLARMTLEEKVGQLHQIAGVDLTGPASAESANRDKLADIRGGRIGSVLTVKGAAATRQFQEMALQSRLKIPLLFALDVIHGHETVFPVPLGEAASWDLAQIEASARIGRHRGRGIGHPLDLRAHGRRGARPALGPRHGRRRRRQLSGVADRARPREGISGQAAR